MVIRDSSIDNGQEFDWGRASKEYAQYRDIYPEKFYTELAGLSLGIEGQEALDLGTGTGVIPRNMYHYGATWTGADISENQIAYAEELSREAGMDIRYVVSSAEEVDFPDKSFDVITACQCFMYFDTKIVLPKIHRMLKPGGHFCILFMAWLPEESEIANGSEELVLKYNPCWTGGHMKRVPLQTPIWCGDLFEVSELLAFDVPVTFTRESWHGRMKACRGISASLEPEKIAAWEKEHMAYMRTVPEVFDVLHYVTMVDVRKKVSLWQMY